MNTPVPNRASSPFLFRHGVDLLAVAAVLFILQTGLIPYDFEWRAGGRGSDDFFGFATSSFTFPDVISNLFLYLPVGAFLFWSLGRRVGHAAVAALLTLVLSAILSGGIEWLQAYSPSRVSSFIDLTCNLLGTAVGVVIGGAVQWTAPRFMKAALHEFHLRPGNSLCVAYCGALVVIAAMPFSLSLDPGLFKKSLKSADWVPFASVRAANGDEQQAHVATSEPGHTYARWRVMKCWSRWAAEAASFAFLAWLLYPVLRDYYGFGRGGVIGMTLWLCAFFACALSLFQLFSVTRDFDVTDILFRLAGAGLGLITYGTSRRSIEPASSDGVADGGRAPAIGCALTLAYITYIGVIPMTFSATNGGLSNAVSAEKFWPFRGYFVTRFDLMIDDVMEKFAIYALLAALLVLCRPALQRLSLHRRVAVMACLGAAISVPLEIVQAFIPVRVTSLTDPILAACGSAAGVLLLAHATTFYRFARSNDFAALAASEESHRRSRHLSLTDALVAQLMDEKEGAPKEPGIEREPTKPSHPTL